MEGVGLKKTPMGVILDLLDQQEEKINKIQDFIESKLKEWGRGSQCATVRSQIFIALPASCISIHDNVTDIFIHLDLCLCFYVEMVTNG